MDKGIIFVPLVGRSAAFVAYWTPRLFFSSKKMPFKNDLHGFQQKGNSFGVPLPPALIQVMIQTLLGGEVSFRNILQPVGVS